MKLKLWFCSIWVALTGFGHCQYEYYPEYHHEFHPDPTVCPDLQGIPLERRQLEGRWYEIKRVNNVFENSQSCTIVNLSFPGNGYKFKSSQKIQVFESIFTFYSGDEMKIEVLFSNGHKYLNNTFTGVQIAPDLGAFSLKIAGNSALSSDVADLYVEYLENDVALIYFCISRYNIKMDLAWVLAREQFPAIYQVESVASNLRVISPDLIMDYVNQHKCANPNFNNRRRLLNFYNFRADGFW